MRPIMLLPLLALAACTPNDTTFGGALKHNIALQVIDPDPVAQTDLIEGGSGDRAASASERYREGTVKQPVSIATTTGGSGGSGSGASASTPPN